MAPVEEASVKGKCKMEVVGISKDVEDWTYEDVESWLESIGMWEYSDLLCRIHRIDGEALVCLRERDLREPPLSMQKLGDIKRLSRAINNIRRRDLSAVVNSHDRIDGCFDSMESEDEMVGEVSPRKKSLHAGAQGMPMATYNGDLPDNTSPRKVLVTSLYVWGVFLLSAFTMTIVHSRVPDMGTYRPLPDIALDNIPHIPWAFQLSEAIGAFFLLTFIIVVLFHKHRVLIICRLNILLGTVFLLRCCTMFVTSLSVPGQHLDCKPGTFDTFEEIIWRSIEITSGFGMSLTGVHTCGDYMFSGHTVVLTMLNFAIAEYTPKRFRSFHMFTWVLNIFGIFFVLAAHEHYSIDVVVAFVITSRLFLYYHALANSGVLKAKDRVRLREWFPLFTYVEEHWNGNRVPNVYGNPLVDLKAYINHHLGHDREASKAVKHRS